MAESWLIADIGRNRCRLKMTGADRVAFLHGQCTNDIKRLVPGQSCYAAFLNAKGKMRGDGYIVCTDEAFWLDASGGLQAALEKFVVTEDVVIEDVSAAWGAWLVIGDLPGLPAGAMTYGHALGTGVLSQPPLPVTLNDEELAVRRIQAGVPEWGVDLDAETIPVEAGLAKRAISYDKGCYIGQETIARIKTYGHVNRQLVQCKVTGGQVPRIGTGLMADGREVGRVTSAAGPWALGYVRREWTRPGVKLAIENQSAEVIRLCGE
jgi:tRNA-modifying protein YgfZ